MSFSEDENLDSRPSTSTTQARTWHEYSSQYLHMYMLCRLSYLASAVKEPWLLPSRFPPCLCRLPDKI